MVQYLRFCASSPGVMRSIPCRGSSASCTVQPDGFCSSMSCTGPATALALVGEHLSGSCCNRDPAGALGAILGQPHCWQAETSVTVSADPPAAPVVQVLSCVQLCDPVDCSPPGFPVLHCLQSLLKFMSTELLMLSNHLILCCLLLLLPSAFPSISVFPSESALRARWPKD